MTGPASRRYEGVMSLSPTTPAHGIQTRQLGAFGAAMLVAGNMIGSGIFLLPAAGAALGSMVILGWAAVTAGALLLAVVFLRLTRLDPLLEMHGHVRTACGEFAGWQSSSLYWIGAVVGNIAIAVAVTGYLTYFFASLMAPVSGALVTSAVILLVTGANIIGPGLVARLSGWTLAVGLVPVLMVAIVGWLWFDPAIFDGSWNVSGRSPVTALPASLGILFWAFCGLESASVVAASVRNPERNVPVATIAGVVIAAVIYVAACTVPTGIIPAATLAQQAAPFAVVFERIVGPVAAALVAICAMLKASGTLAGWILLTTETARDGAQAGLFPRFFGRSTARGIPVLNLMVSAGLMIAITFMTLTPTIGKQFGILVNASVLFAMTAYLWCCIALFRRDRRLGSRTLAVCALLFCAGVILATDPRILTVYLCFFALSPLAYFFVWRGRRVAAVT